MVYLNQQKGIYAKDIQGASSNQDIFIYDHASEKEQKQLEIQKEEANKLQQLHQDIFVRNQQLKRLEKKLKEIDEDKKYDQQLQAEVLNRLDVLDEHTNNKNKQLKDVFAMYEMAKEETQEMKHNQEAFHAKLEKIEITNENISRTMEKQDTRLDEIQHQINQKEEAYTELYERLDKQEAWLEKLMRQVHDLRSIIYERADEIINKVEKSIQLFGGKWNIVQRNDEKLSKESVEK
ncbi:hypothetical protein [Gracilibacillus alcaliphilus]|uniref:hypothetical protein n=1 Tax=Gracilibacillus alcaliphilus TaxID=1401441 RepID=UPI00195E2AB3|nr:hypothetical protein [Gracilibacillus alcaliphilus]MBM7678823.1 chromosome segregation ATPase [Gracilibacillus alcaliphilus]